MRRPKALKYVRATPTTAVLPRLSSESVSVSSKTGSDSVTATLPVARLQLALDNPSIGYRYVCHAGCRQCQNLDRTWRDINVFSVVTPEQRDHLTLEAPAASFRIGGNLLSESGRKPNCSRDRRIRSYRGPCHTKSIPYWLAGARWPQMLEMPALGTPSDRAGRIDQWIAVNVRTFWVVGDLLVGDRQRTSDGLSCGRYPRMWQVTGGQIAGHRAVRLRR